MGAILAVVVLYWKSFLNWPLLKRLSLRLFLQQLSASHSITSLKTYLVGNEVVVLLALLIGA